MTGKDNIYTKHWPIALGKIPVYKSALHFKTIGTLHSQKDNKRHTILTSKIH